MDTNEWLLWYIYLSVYLFLRAIFEIVRTNDLQDFLRYFPQLSGLYTKVLERFRLLNQEIERIMEEDIMSIEDQKNAALQTKKYNIRK